MQVHDDGKVERETFKCKYCEKEFKRKEHVQVHQTKSKCVVMRAELASSDIGDIKIFRELVKKGYSGTCVFCKAPRKRLKDHVWREHQLEMRQLYSRVNEKERLKAHYDGRSYDEDQRLLSKRKGEQEALKEALIHEAFIEVQCRKEVRSKLNADKSVNAEQLPLHPPLQLDVS